MTIGLAGRQNDAAIAGTRAHAPAHTHTHTHRHLFHPNSFPATVEEPKRSAKRGQKTEASARGSVSESAAPHGPQRQRETGQSRP
eukprot:15475650-Alexandrium_andersonii.AAC.1